MARLSLPFLPNISNKVLHSLMMSDIYLIIERISHVIYKIGKQFIPWCGLLIDTVTMEVQADYTRCSGSCILFS